MHELQESHPEFLTGWKDIANYLRRAVRTVQRYEIQMGLPVRRPAGRGCGSVLATKGELDAWLSGSPRREITVPLTTPAWYSKSASAQEVRSGLLEMRKQRNRLITLKAGLAHSVRALSDNIEGLRGQLRVDRNGRATS